MKLVIKLLIYALAVFVGAYILPGITVDSWASLLIVSVVLVVLKAVLKPILVILTLPITILTLGLFILVINTLIILIADWLVDGFQVDGIVAAFIFSLLLSVVVAVLEAIVGKDDE